MAREKESKASGIIAGILAASIIVYGSYEISNMYYFQPEAAIQLKQQVKLDELKNSNNESERIKANASQLEQSLASAEKQFSTLTPLVPTQRELPQIQESLAKKAYERALKFDFFTSAGAPIPRGSMLEIPLQIDVVGYYDSIGRYIEEFSRFERLLQVRSVTMKLEKSPLNVLPVQTPANANTNPNLDPQAAQMLAAAQGSMVTMVRATIKFSAYVIKEKSTPKQAK